MSGYKGKSSVSSSVNLRYGRGFARKTVTKCQNLRDGAARQARAYAKFRERVAGLTYDEREDLMAVDPDVMQGIELYPIPLGDEGVLASHEGGEDQLCREIFEEQWIRRDKRTRRDRTDLRNTEWAAQLPHLTDAYLAWKDTSSAIPSNSSTPPHTATSNPSDPLEPPSDPLEPPSASDRLPDLLSCPPSWSIVVVDMFDYHPASFLPTTASELPNVTLLRGGYLGVSPVAPTLAISLKVLECYRQLHAVCPRLSVQAFCQGVCALHQRIFIPKMAEQFSSCFDVYLDLLHQVDVRVSASLDRDKPEWRMRHVCPPCLYVVEGEPSPPTLLATMDGNSSLKLVDDSFRSGERYIDRRTLRTDIYLSNEEVDCFKDEVRDAQKRRAASSNVPTGPAVPSTSSASTSTAAAAPSANARGKAPASKARRPQPQGSAADIDGSDGDNDGDLEEAQWINEDTVTNQVDEPSEATSLCAERWRNAGPEARKKMFTLFKVTGIFALLCRHGQVLVLCDMIRSGELMKYPLAIVKKLLDVYGSEYKIVLGYDIGCEFAKILDRSSLGPRAKGVVMPIVPAFHGHSHNRACQLDWHPMYRDGVGKEDFEGCERFFSSSNSLASGTRLASDFHRHQAIEGHVSYWNGLKHAESGRFIFNNYRQALQIIEDGERALAVYAHELKIGPQDFERYLQEEREYLLGLKSEPAEYALKFEYVRALRKLEEAGRKDAVAVDMYKKLDELIIREGITEKEIRRIRREYAAAPARVAQAQEEANRLADALDLDSPWLPTSDEYKQASLELDRRKYRLALDNLERLVVQRLFELNKLGLNGVGYKLRDKIGKALKTRAEAIRKALAKYNKYASELKPPKPELSLGDVMELVSLGEFDLLRETRQDIREKPWAQRTHRDAMNTHYNVKRACEEISRLNVEITRLFSYMVDEHMDYRAAVLAARAMNSTLASELATRQQYLTVVNERVVGWLFKTSQLQGFSGQLKYACRVGRDKSLLDTAALPPWATHSGGDNSTATSSGGSSRVPVTPAVSNPTSAVATGCTPLSSQSAASTAGRAGFSIAAMDVAGSSVAAMDVAGGRVPPARDASNLPAAIVDSVSYPSGIVSTGVEAALQHGVSVIPGVQLLQHPGSLYTDDLDLEEAGGIPGAGSVTNSGRLVKFFDSLASTVDDT